MSLGPALLHPCSWGDPGAWVGGGFPSPRRAGRPGRSSLNSPRAARAQNRRCAFVSSFPWTQVS